MKRKTKIIINSILAILIFILLCSIWLCVPKYDEKAMLIPNHPQNATTSLPEHNNATIEQAIINYSIDNGINYETSLRIADCESKMGKYKVNWDGSSAYGLYQFMPRTFNAYCQGSIESDIDQIRCFIKLYNKHPNWWVCK
ncbi:MAG: hypothetical protein EOL97_13865 [Spirochaetia bacterium]|nr:hypothetical protein [Spirochaetia bacterium]